MRKAWCTRLLVLVATGMVLTGCPESCDPPPDPTAEPSVTSVNVTPSTASIAVGETVQLAAVVVGEGDLSQEVNWSSDDDTVATVDANGLATGVAPGVVAVTATSVFDPGFSGRADITVGAPGEGAGVVILTPDLLLVELGETYALEAVAYDSGGGVVTDAVIDWSSSDPSIVSVDADGVVTAEEVVGSVTISATWQGSTDSIYVLVALLTPDTIRIARADVLLIGPAYDTVVLARNPTTESLGVGDVFTSGEVVGRVTAVAGHDNGIIVEFEPVGSFEEVFALFYVHAISDPVTIEGTLSPEGLALTTSIGGVRRTSFLQPQLRCDEAAWDDSVEWEFIKGKYEFEIDVRTEFEHGLDVVWETWGIIPYPALTYEGSRAVLTGGPRWDIETPGIRVEAAVQGALDCFASAGSFTIPMLGIPGIVTLDGVVEPRLGFEAAVEANGELTVMGPTLENGHVTFTLGFEHDPDDGLEWIYDADASLGDFEPLGALSVAADASLAAGPYLSISGGVGIVLFASNKLSVEIHFAEPRLYLTLDGSLETPILLSQRGYKGLEWALQYGVQADLKIEVAGGVADVLDYFELPTTFGEVGMDIWGPVVWAESPEPTVARRASHASAVAPEGAARSSIGSSGPSRAITFTSEVPERYEGAEIQFWGFVTGSDIGARLADGQVDGQGVAEATWQPGADEAGEYLVRAHLHSGVLGRINLPYPSPTMLAVDLGAPPNAVDDEVSLFGPVPGPFGPAEVAIDVLANDDDPGGGSLRIVDVTQPHHFVQGSVRHTDERVYYTFGASTNVTVTFAYTIENEAGLRASATVSVRIGSLLADDPHQDWGISDAAIGVVARINEAGDTIATGCDVYGSCTTRFRSSDGRFTDLGTLGGSHSAAMGLNDQAVVVGWSRDASRARRPFIWDAVGGMRDLGTGPVGYREGGAMAVSNEGSVVGVVGSQVEETGLGRSSVDRLSPFYPDGAFRPGRAVMWRAGVFIDLHDALEARLGVDGRSIATGVTDGDPIPVVVGTFYQYFPHHDEPFCFMWTDLDRNDVVEPGEIVLLPSLGGAACRVHDVSERGHVVGVSTDAANVARPFLWSPPDGIRALVQPAGGVEAVARAVNVHGQVVGNQVSNGSRVPLYWLGDAVATPSNVAGLPSGWVLESIEDINDRGDMVGVARTPDDALRAILLRAGN